MPLHTRTPICLLLLALLVASLTRGSLAYEDLTTLSKCAEKGFKPGDLACSTCTKLEHTIRSLGTNEADSEAAKVVEDCKACCTATLDNVSPTKFAKAELKLCRFTLSSYGGVNEFTEKSRWKDAIEITDSIGETSAHARNADADAYSPWLDCFC